MRCTRCGRIAVPQAVGITREGLVVFGWCLDCLALADCRLVEVSGAGLSTPPRLVAIRRPGPRSVGTRQRSRRLAVATIAGAMALWAAALMALGGARLLRPSAAPPNPLGNGDGAFLLAGGALMAATSLSLAATLLDGARLIRWALRAIQLGAALVAFVALATGIARDRRQDDPAVVLVAALALGLSWTAYWGERRVQSSSRCVRTPLGEPGEHL